ncbi:hypothetical protein ASE40_07725 [Flavobacterium sp. Root935]|uniref:hypothetical protein n=1 Tax=unclassified Flavobacterium TaxID=196869 RepID=UPI000710B9AE|nr:MULTISPECIES: hypothetical protein [unclassified Flavobacterium]KRD61414.1 hypothetical protein ASE40_07725 [Flavobacterium sp. Root935]TDX12722.1 hypothetical protein EDB96_1801 [Flavobacterium sp. S87F.05.LMB.W.Kidney.N]
MKKIFYILLFVNHAIFSQQIETFNYPKNTYRSIKNKFSINPTPNYQAYYDYYFEINLEDFFFNKNKPIKDVSYYYNNNKAKMYFIEFTRDGKIQKIENFYYHKKITFNYSNKIITRQSYAIGTNIADKLSSTDSIFYDYNNNIIKKSLTNYDQKQNIIERHIEDYQYIDKNKLVKKYQYEIRENVPFIFGSLSLFEYADNTITEKTYNFGDKNHSIQELKKDSTIFNSNPQKKIYYLDKKGEFSKIDHFFSNKIENSITIKYDEFNRINSVNSTKFKVTGTYGFEFDAKNNIVELSNEGVIFNYKYDENNNVISEIIKSDSNYDKDSNGLEYDYQYDMNDNWITITIIRNGSIHSKRTRKINYY